MACLCSLMTTPTNRYQRRWVMQRAPLPPWKEELENCNFFLKKDERNFHCWDYRRWVVKNSTHESAEAAAEFAYTLSKISDQFSNYSAWHYRSTLLPKVCPADGDEAAVNSVSQDALGEEFSMLASAFYIDPCDQAAWIYHRWLLGREETPPSVCAAYTAEDATCIHLVYSHPVSVNSEAVTVSDAEGNPLEVAWTAGNGASASRAGRRVPSSLWAVRRPNNAAFPETVSLKFDGGVTSTSGLAAAPFASAVPAAGSGVYYSAGGELLQRLARYRLPSAALLCEQLDMCTELLEELDDGPEKKWPLLATVYILFVASTFNTPRLALTRTLHSIATVSIPWCIAIKSCPLSRTSQRLTPTVVDTMTMSRASTSGNGRSTPARRQVIPKMAP